MEARASLANNGEKVKGAYNLLPSEALVVDTAPGSRTVEFSGGDPAGASGGNPSQGGGKGERSERNE